MPQISPDTSSITTFGFSANIDIYGRSITFNLLPFTTGPNLGSRPVAFSVVDQSGVALASINWVSPQIPDASTITSWVLDLSSVDFAFLFQSYSIYAAIQDSGGQVYQTIPVIKTLCQPQNLTDTGYVPGLFNIISDCINSVLTVKEITLLVYNNLQPTSVSKTGTLNYPTGTISPVSFANTPFSNNVVYTGQYNIQCTTVATYSLNDDIFVLVSYITYQNFDVTCQNRIADLMCCILKVQETAITHCDDEVGMNAKDQLNNILPYIVTGIGKEISGQDSTFEANYIQKYLNCNCGSKSLSQSEFTPINPAVTSIVLQGVGGTNIPAPTVTGNTKTYSIRSSVYQVAKGNPSDLAFTITTDTTVANTVKYLLAINYDTFAGSILTAIGNDPALENQLNALIQSISFNPTGLNGRCVIDLTKANYSLSQAVNSSTLITQVVINGTVYNAPSNLFANNPSPIQTWLNSLSLGTFTVAVSSNTLSIVSVGNSNVIATMTFTTPNVTTSFQPHYATENQVFQALFDYICQMTALQVALGNNLSICSFDYNGNNFVTNLTSNATQAAFNASVASSICTIVARILSLTGLTCAKLQAIFSDNPNANFSYAGDRYLTIVGGTCTTLTAKQQALAFIAAVNADSQTKAAFCAINCSTPGTCPDITAINAGPVAGGIGIYGVTFNNTPSASQTVTVKYKLNSSSTYITATSNLVLFPNGNVSGTSPYVIPGLTAGQTYNVMIVNNCGGNGFTTQVTVPSSSVYSGAFRLDNSQSTICADSTTTLYSSVPFAVGVTMYTNSGLTTPITGFTFIADSTGTIYALNSTTGVVGAATGNNCNNGTPGTYKIGTNISTVCSATNTTLYTNGAFAVGGTLYNDPALSSPVTGNTYVVNTSTNHIFNLNSSTGVIGSDTGTLCTGTATLTFSFVNAGGSFLNFQANLSRAIDANININEVFADGFNNGTCSGGAVASAQSNTTNTLFAGSTGIGYNPDTTSGSWASASHYSMYNVRINGVPHVNGDVVTIGSYSVTIMIPSCN